MATRADTINQATNLLMGIVEGFANSQIQAQAKSLAAEREAQWQSLNLITKEAIERGAPEAILGISDSLKKVGYKPDAIEGFANLATQRRQVMQMEREHTDKIVNAAIEQGYGQFNQAIAGIPGAARMANAAPAPAPDPIQPRAGSGAVPPVPPGIAQAATQAGIQVPGQPAPAEMSSAGTSGSRGFGVASGVPGAPLAAQPPPTLQPPPAAPPAQARTIPQGPVQPMLPEPATMPDLPFPQPFPGEAAPAAEPGVALPPTAPIELPPIRPAAPEGAGTGTLEVGRIGSDVGPQLRDDAQVVSYFRDRVLPTLTGLQPGQNLSLKVNDKVTLTFNGNEAAQARVRKILSVAERAGLSPTALDTVIRESGLPVDEKAIDAYAQTLSAKTFKALVPEFAKAVGGKVSDRAVQQAAAFETWQRTGYVNPAYRDLTFASKEDAQRESLRLVNEQIAAGKSAPEVLRNARTMHYPLTPEEEQGVLEAEYSRVFKDAIERQLTPEQAGQLAGAAINFHPKVVNSERIKQAFPVPPTEGVAGEAYSQGAGIRPSPDAVRRAQTAVTGRDVDTDRQKAQQRSDIELQQRREIVRPGSAAGPAPGRPAAGAPAGESLQQAEARAAKAGSLSVPDRPGEGLTEKVANMRDTLDSTRRLRAALAHPDVGYSAVGIGQETLGDILEKVGGKSPAESAFRAEVRRIASSIMRTEAGLSQTSNEEARQKLIVPLLGLPASAFIPRLEGVIEDLRARTLNRARGAREANLMTPDTRDLEAGISVRLTATERLEQLKARGMSQKERLDIVEQEIRSGLTVR